MLHNIMTLRAILKRAYTRRYPSPFLNARATKVWSLPFFFTKVVALATFLEISKKRSPDRSSAPKTLSFGEKIAKIGPADPEIICL